jgi:hypothetical protein
VLVPDYYDYFNAPVIGFEFGFGEVNGHHHRYDRRERHRDNLTECLAPEGFCPGDRSGQFHSGGRNHRGGSGFSDSTVSSGNAELHIAPGADSSAGRRGGPPPTECLAPEGFCLTEGKDAPPPGAAGLLCGAPSGQLAEAEAAET